MIIVVMMWIGLSTSTLSAQKISELEWKQGYHGFDFIVQGLGLKHQTLRQWNSKSPKESLLVVLGARNLGRVKLDAYLNSGGAVLIADDGVRDTNAAMVLRRNQGIRLDPGQMIVNDERDGFEGLTDCPYVTDLRLPFLSGVKVVVTNQPGAVRLAASSPWKPLGTFPPCNSTSKPFLFAVGGERKNGAKLICYSDSSIFSNQMLPHGDNALLAKSTLEYLIGSERTNVLILKNGVVMDAVDPLDLDVELPQPTREEVIDALKDLPPSAMLDFANTVIGVVQDENMVNEFVKEQVDRARPPVVNRFLIFCAFALGCLVAAATYFFQKKMNRTTGSDIAYQKAEHKQRLQKKLSKSEASKSKLCFERQMAVLGMLDELCLKRVDQRFNDLAKFPDDLNIGNDEHGTAIKRAMKVIHDDFKSKPRVFWTTKRLLGVEKTIAHWKEYFELNSGSTQPAESGRSKIIQAKVVDK